MQSGGGVAAGKLTSLGCQTSRRAVHRVRINYNGEADPAYLPCLAGEGLFFELGIQQGGWECTGCGRLPSNVTIASHRQRAAAQLRPKEARAVCKIPASLILSGSWPYLPVEEA